MDSTDLKVSIMQERIPRKRADHEVTRELRATFEGAEIRAWQSREVIESVISLREGRNFLAGHKFRVSEFVKPSSCIPIPLEFNVHKMAQHS